jgi:histone H3/H4
MSRYPIGARRQLLVRWEFEKAWREMAQEWGDGGMDEAAYTEAVRAARERVDKLDDMAVSVEVCERLTRQGARRVEQEQKQGLSKEALEEVRETMEQFLAQWGEAGQKAVLRGAIASVFLSERRKLGTDADGVWLMGKVQAYGTRAAGIANKMIEALGDLGIMGFPLRRVLEEVFEELRP